MTSKNKRSLKNGYQYDSLISKADLKTLKLSNFINVDETVQSMKMIVQQRHQDTIKLAQILKRNTINDTCKAIFDFVYEHIQYTKDRAGFEEIRTPARSWADRVHGVDCDCYSVFIGSILYNLGIPFAFRVTKYSADWQHVYPIAYDQTSTKGYRIIDCVVDEYDYEVPYTDKKDYKMSTLMLSGIDNYNYRETSVREDLAGLGNAKKKKKEEKKAARKDKKTTKKAAKTQAKANKQTAKKAKKETKKFGGSKNGKKQTTSTKKKGGIFSKVKAKVQKGKEKRQIKKAAKKEKKAANPKKKGILARIKEKKKDKKEKKAAQQATKVTTTKVTPTLVNQNTSSQTIQNQKDEFDTPEVTTTPNIQKDEFADTSTSSKEFMSPDGETYGNQGSWGGDGKKVEDPIFDTTQLEKEMNQDADKAIQNSNQNLEQDIQNLTQNITSKALAIKEPNEVVPNDDVEELETSVVDDKGNKPEEGEKEGMAKYVEQAITYAKENPVIVGSVAVGVPVVIWGLTKVLSKKSINGVDGIEDAEFEDMDGLDGLGKNKKGKKKSKNKTKKSKSTKPKTTSKAHRKHGIASFNGLK